jgi:hypothetical protein
VATSESNVIYDGFAAFDGGTDSGTAPTQLPKNQMGYATNVTVRGGFATDRPPFNRIALNFGNDRSFQKSFEQGLFQVAGSYQPDMGNECLIASIGGILFEIVPDNSGNATISDISIPGDINPASQPQAWAVQAENYFILNDGISLPLFYDGTVTRRSIGGQEIILGTTSEDFNVPAIGSTVDVTLTGDFKGYFGETVLIGDATYQAKNPGSVGGNTITIENVDATPGASFPAGTVIQYDPNIAAIYRLHPGAGNISIPNGTIIPLGYLLVEPPYTGPIGATIYWPLVDYAYFNWTVMGADATSISIRLNTFNGGTISGSDAVMFPYNSLMWFAPGGQPVQDVGQTTADYSAPNADQDNQATLLNSYSGPAAPAILTIGGSHFIIRSAGASTGGNNLTLLNINDTTGTPGTTPPSVTAPANIYGIPELPAGQMLAYGMGRVWEVMTDGISFLAGDVVGGSSGSPNLQFRDSVLKITENLYLAGGGLFRVPGSVGNIRGLLFTATLDVSLGQGPLQVFTSQSVFSCQTPVDRTTWQSLTNPILTEALKGAGGAGQWSLVNSNADILFRSPDAELRSLVLSRLDFYKWGDTPISYEMLRLILTEDESLMNFCSAIVFDNRLLMTASPSRKSSGVVWSNLIALNFDEISSLQNKAAAAYDGVWNGMNVLQLVRFVNSNRAFAFCSNPTTNAIELWELLPTDSEHFDNGIVPITWQFESPVIFSNVKGKGFFDLVRLIDGELYISDLQGRVDITVEYRPDWSPCWYPWAAFYVCAATGAGLSNQYRSRLGLGEPSASTCVQFNNKPAREARFFQTRITFTGHCVFQGAKFGAVPVPEYEFEPPLCNEPAAEAGPLVAPQVWNELVYFPLVCSSSVPVQYSGPALPNWIALDYSRNQLVGFPHYFKADTQALANAAAQKALNDWATPLVAQGYFVCVGTYIPLKDDETTGLLGTDCMQLRYLNGAYFLTRSSSNGVFRSVDGLAWTHPLSGASGLLYDIAFGNGVYVAVGQQLTSPYYRCVVYTSTDGIVWTEHDDTSIALNSYSVAFGGGKFCRIDNYGIAGTSLDGVTWTAHSQIQSTSLCRKVQYLNGKFWACFPWNVWSASDPTGAWVQGSIGGGYNCRDIAFGNGVYVAVGVHTVYAANQGWTAVSVDGVNWIAADLGGESAVTGITFANGTFAACGASGKVYFSGNGSGFFASPLVAAAGLNNIVTDGNGTIIAAEGTDW